MEFTEQTLRSRLLSLGVHLELWGKDEAKSVEHLVEELNAGECVLDGKVRTIRPVVLDVWYLRMQLRETFQIFSDLRVRVRELKFGSVGEKLRIGEGAKAGAWRALREELGVKNRHDTYIDPLPGDEWEELSSSYPGLVTRNIQSRFLVRLSKTYYNPEGYVERQKDKSTHFHWVHVPE